MKKSLSLLSCCLIFIVDHISSLSFDITYNGFKGLSKMPVIKIYILHKLERPLFLNFSFLYSDLAGI